MKKIYLICFAILIIHSTISSQVFTLVDSIQYSQAQIWGVLSDDGDSLATTTIFNPGTKPHIYLRKGSYNSIANQSTPVQLTFDADFTGISNLTDHKSLILHDELFVTFSTQGDSDLYIFKTDLNGNRIGSIVSVVQNQTDPTNDMMLVTDSTYIYVLHFDPPNQHHVYKFDSDLNPIGVGMSTTGQPHNNIGNILLHNNEFWMLTGDFFGTNASIVLSKWDTAWNGLMPSTQTIVSSSGGDGNWFSTGMIWDDTNQRWYVGMSHLNSGESINQEHIDLMAFDINWNLLQRIHITGQSSYRPHFVLKNGFLYVSYDRPGNVYLLKYQVANTVGTDKNYESILKVFPNPVTDLLYINAHENLDFEITNIYGSKILQSSTAENSIINVQNLIPGIYFLRCGNTMIKFIKTR